MDVAIQKTVSTSQPMFARRMQPNKHKNKMHKGHYRPIEVIKEERSRSWYSSSAGKSSNPLRMFLWGLAVACWSLFFVLCPSSSTDVCLNKSKTKSVSIDANPEFCCVTTEFAILSLKRCRLKLNQFRARTRCHITYPMIFSSRVPFVIKRYTLTTFFCPMR
jgi:hypothetical protein